MSLELRMGWHGKKKGQVLRPSHTTAGFIPQRDHKEKMTCTKIFIATLFVVAKNWKMTMSFNWGMVMEYYCAQRNNKLEKFHVNWNDLQELKQSERRRTRRMLYTETDTLWYNQTEWTSLLAARQ